MTFGSPCACAYGADASLSDVALGKVMFGRDLSKGALKLKLDPKKAQVDGTAALGRVHLVRRTLGATERGGTPALGTAEMILPRSGKGGVNGTRGAPG